MFIPLTEPERQAFMSQNSGCHIPGYTGHCPTLKFRFGRCYGANTKDIIKELRDTGILKNIKKEQNRVESPTGKVTLSPLKVARIPDKEVFDVKNRSTKYILGYTGYIPGLNFRYGKSYSRSADDSMYEFGERQSIIKKKLQDEQMLRANSAPKMVSLRSKDEVDRTLKEYEEKMRFKERTISPEYPPIAGYTGHIPRVKGNEASLSQRYYCVAKQGLSLLYQDRNRRNNLTEVENRIRNVVHEQEEKYDRS